MRNHSFVTNLQRCLETLIGLGLLLIAVIVIVQVVLSAGFNSSITGANEIITKVFVYVTSIGAALAVGRGDHIAITFATDKLKTQQRLIQIVELILVASLNVIVLAYSYHWMRITGHYLMPTTQLPRMFAQFSIPLGSAAAVLFSLLRIATLLSSARTTAGDEV